MTKKKKATRPTQRASGSGASPRAAKVLQRAIRKSEAKDPPTVGKPVITDPPGDVGPVSGERRDA